MKSPKTSDFISKEEKNVVEEEDEGKLRRSERCQAKVEIEASACVVPAQTGRRKRTTKLEIVSNNEEEVKASPAKRRRLSSKDVENAEKKDGKYRIESNIELQSSPEPEKELYVLFMRAFPFFLGSLQFFSYSKLIYCKVKHAVEGESDDDKKLVDLRTRSRTSKVVVSTGEKLKSGTSSETSSVRSPKRSAVVTRSSRRQTRRVWFSWS
ncbi:unnamed protein product [Brugia pahangi]|uniref:Uncharacterized protein n=1 Tax=Brugia pahangi TaxID=6280 RepID=A0A0N4TDB5_BRUPA|nr:unnamed protein product [Brugia pahangi]